MIKPMIDADEMIKNLAAEAAKQAENRSEPCRPGFDRKRQGGLGFADERRIIAR